MLDMNSCTYAIVWGLQVEPSIQKMPLTCHVNHQRTKGDTRMEQTLQT